MFANHPVASTLRKLGVLESPEKAAAKAAAEKAALDSANEAKINAVLDAADSFTEAGVRLEVAASVQEWVNTPAEDLDENETMADRLIALMVGLADENKDGDITEDEEILISAALEAAADYMIGKGVAEADVVKLLEEGDDEAAGRVVEFLKAELPSEDDAALEDVDAFAFDADSSASLFDSVLDAVYKKKVVVRGGRKVRINKRVSGRVLLSSGQKIAIRKARRKAHSASAKLRRARSMKIRARSGI